MLNDLFAFLKHLVPPADSKGVTKWRWAIFIAVVIVSIDTLLGRGIFWGLGGYAANETLTKVLELNYAEVIRDLQAQICTVLPTRDVMLENLLEDYQLQYESLHGSRYPAGLCR